MTRVDGYRVCLAAVLALQPLAAADSPEAIEFFERQVRPLFQAKCVACHGPGQQQSSLRVDSREALLRGGNRGPAIAPGDAKLSLLAKALRHEGLKMPAGARLADAEIAAVERWINLGAPWPEQRGGAAPASAGLYERIKREHWAFQRVRDPLPPDVENGVDRFLRAAQDAARLKPAARAGKETLARRLSLTLTGLPPTPLEVDLFVKDASPDAYEKFVDRLLGSPHFGEHWARHWMDVMRFAETFGNDWNYEIKGAWLYRDYLIRAFNRDVPYDQLVREHVAGDLLERPRISAREGVNESILGTSFLRLGELGHDDCIRFRQIRTDVVDNQIDTLTKAFQGLTAACARCHDHKLDPIPTSDYYALYGALTSSRMAMRSAATVDSDAALKRRLGELKPVIRAEMSKQWTRDADRIPRFLMAAHRASKGLAPKPEDLAELPLDRVQAWLALLEKEKPAMEDPLYPWTRFSEWPELKGRYAEEAAKRAAFNREHFRPFGDAAQGGFAGWHADGSALAGGPTASGDFAVANTGPRAIAGVFPAGLYTHVLSERLEGAARSPLVPKDKKFLSLEIMGGGMAAWRTVLDNCMLSEDYQLIEHDTARWLKIPNRQDQPDLPFYVELVTKALNPRIPDRPGRLKVTDEQVASPYSYFGIRRAVLHDVEESPRDELTHMERLFEGTAPADLQALAERYASIAREAVSRWANRQADEDDVRWIAWLLDHRLLSNDGPGDPKLGAPMEEYRAAESRLREPKAFHGVADVDPGYDFPVLVAGDASHPGKLAPRGFLQLIAGEGGIKAFGSGRREIAELIANPANPLTARVMANRIWQYVFGSGIVTTADNFGVYGERPSHPELLDHLAARFVRDGWSVKKSIRRLVLSEAFRQEARASAEAAAADPRNRLLSHFPLRRLEAESIRDAILAVSGRLDRTMYGPGTQPYREEPKDYRKLHQGPLDGNGRRSVYLKVTRHEGSRFLETFDFPNPTVARGNRDTTNVPPQALALLNDAFVLDQAGVWAARLLARQAPTAEARIAAMFREALGRLPDADESARFTGLTKELASLRKTPPEKILDSREVWADLAHAIFNLKEFIYLR